MFVEPRKASDGVANGPLMARTLWGSESDISSTLRWLFNPISKWLFCAAGMALVWGHGMHPASVAPICISFLANSIVPWHTFDETRFLTKHHFVLLVWNQKVRQEASRFHE